MNRHGVLTRGAVAAEGVPGGFATLYKVLSSFEDAGRCQRGYFVESLGGAQFAVASTVDRLRSYLDGVDPERPEYRAVVLAAADPANPYGAALPWPEPRAARVAPAAGRAARPGALVVLVDGELAWFLERGGRSLLTFTDDPAADHAAAMALADLVAARRVASILVERVDGAPALQPARAGRSRAVRWPRCQTPASPVRRADCGCGEPCPRVTPSGTRRPRCVEHLAGRTLTRCDIRVPRFATVDLTGHVVDEVLSRGKHLFIRVGPASIHSHLKMDGSWRVGNPSGAGGSPGTNHLGSRRAFAPSASIWACSKILDRAHDRDVVAHLGPDLLGEDWDPRVAAANLTARPDRPLAEALLDQRVLAGVGNVYCNELCFVSGHLPTAPVSAVTDPVRLLTRARNMLWTNRFRWNRCTTGDTRAGRQLWVYGRAGQPCRRCGTRIELRRHRRAGGVLVPGLPALNAHGMSLKLPIAHAAQGFARP